MKNILLFICTFCYLSTTFVYAQTEYEECGTIPKTDEEMEALPWFGDEDYLMHVLDSVDIYLDEGRFGNREKINYGFSNAYFFIID